MMTWCSLDAALPVVLWCRLIDRLVARTGPTLAGLQDRFGDSLSGGSTDE
jgi:hypothetical protein